MVKHSRRYSAVAEKVDPEKTYGPKEAMELLKEVSTAKFDETVEPHIRTNVDPRHADQMIRGVCNLPHGLGKTIRVVVFAGAVGIVLGAMLRTDGRQAARLAMWITSGLVGTALVLAWIMYFISP